MINKMRIGVGIALSFSLIALSTIFICHRIRPVYEFPIEWEMIGACDNRADINLIAESWDVKSVGKYSDMYDLKGFSTWSKDVDGGYVQLIIYYDAKGVVTHKYCKYYGKHTGFFNQTHEIK